MTPEEKFRAGADLFEEASEWTLAGIAARYPEMAPEERTRKLKRLLRLAERSGA